MNHLTINEKTFAHYLSIEIIFSYNILLKNHFKNFLFELFKYKCMCIPQPFYLNSAQKITPNFFSKKKSTNLWIVLIKAKDKWQWSTTDPYISLCTNTRLHLGTEHDRLCVTCGWCWWSVEAYNGIGLHNDTMSIR